MTEFENLVENPALWLQQRDSSIISLPNLDVKLIGNESPRIIHENFYKKIKFRAKNLVVLST
jgi:hypothetical protein